MGNCKNCIGYGKHSGAPGLLTKSDSQALKMVVQIITIHMTPSSPETLECSAQNISYKKCNLEKVDFCLQLPQLTLEVLKVYIRRLLHIDN